MENTLQDLKSDFIYSVADLLVALLALECLESCEKENRLDPLYPTCVVAEYRRTMNCLISQHAEELALAANRLAEADGRKENGLPKGNP